MAAGAGDHLMLSRLGLGEENAETAGSSTILVHENVVNAVAFLSNGLLATAAGKVVAMWDVNACTMQKTLNHEGTVNALHLNTEGSLLATCGNDRKVTTWSLPRGERVKELQLDGWVRARPLAPEIPPRMHAELRRTAAHDARTRVRRARPPARRLQPAAGALCRV